MEKITFTAADGTTTDYFPQSYTDAAVATALAAAPVSATATITEVDVVESDGSTVKLTPSA